MYEVVSVEKGARHPPLPAAVVCPLAGRRRRRLAIWALLTSWDPQGTALLLYCLENLQPRTVSSLGIHHTHPCDLWRKMKLRTTGAARPQRTEHPHGARAAVTCRSVRPPLLLVLALLVAGTPLLDAHDYVDDASFPLLETHVPLWSGDEAPCPLPPVRPGVLPSCPLPERD